ncbi:hypothetical protein GIB67_012351, partial [Kingdonia uniflora]
VQNIEVIDASALVSALNFCTQTTSLAVGNQVSALNFCSQTTSLAVGNQSGLDRIYKLSGTSCETSIHFVTKTKNEGGPRMFNSTHQDMILRRKLEEAELRQALELQSRRLMGLQLLDIKKLHHHQRNMSSGSAPISSPHSPHMNHNLIVPLSFLSDRSSPNSPSPQEICGSPPSIIVKKNVMNDEKAGFPNSNNHDDFDFHNSSNSNNIINNLEHNLPDSPFASPTKSGGDNHPFFTTITSKTDKMSLSSSSSSTSTTNNSLILSSLLPAAATSTLNISSYKSCFFPITRREDDANQPLKLAGIAYTEIKLIESYRKKEHI